MKRALITFFILIIALLSFSKDYNFIFKDGLVNFIKMSPGKHKIENNAEIMWVIGSNGYSVSYEDFSPKFKIIDIKDYSYNTLKEIENNYYLVDDSNKIIYFNNKINSWVEILKEDFEVFNSNKILNISSDKDVYVGLKYDANWKNFYELKSNGNFKRSIEINSDYKGKGYTFLISTNINSDPNYYYSQVRNVETFSKSAMGDSNFSENINNEIYTVELRDFSIDSNKIILNLYEKDIINYEDRNLINFTPFSSNGSKNMLKYRLIENADYNGLGLDINSGEVFISEKFDDIDFPLKKSFIDNYAKDELIRLSLGESWNMKYKIEKISDKNFKSQSTRIMEYKISIYNYDDKIQKVSILSDSLGMSIESIKFGNNISNIENNSKENIIDINFDISKSSDLIITLKYLYNN